MDYKKFSRDLIYWYEQNKRDLPWRATSNPYFIWLSEIILQQTRVQQGLPYYFKFITTYPTLADLAKAEESQVLRLWEGLGYYSRARNMLQTARHIQENLNGQFPDSYQDLVKLKGVGKYTAGAIASFAYNEVVPVVDGNVMRVLSRVFGVFDDISTGRGQAAFISLANQLLPQENCSTFNQSLMEFGATLCTPKRPNCVECIFNHTCYAYRKDLIPMLPVKNNKLEKKVRALNYFVIRQGNNLLMQERTGNDIWKGLFEFYLVKDDQSPESMLETFLRAATPGSIKVEEPKETVKHVLTHQIIRARFWEIEIENGMNLPFESKSLKFFTKDEIYGLPKSVLIMKYLNKNYF